MESDNMLVTKHYWAPILSLIKQYLLNTTICIIWNEHIAFDLDLSNGSLPSAAVVSIGRRDLEASFSRDLFNYATKRAELQNKPFTLNALMQKLTMSIEQSHCESFIAFQEDIPAFVAAYRNASTYSIWRSTRNRFVFAFYGDLMVENYFEGRFFDDQASILLVESSTNESNIFQLSTNKFVGPRSEGQHTLYSLDRYDAACDCFDHNANLFPDKIQNLQGREVVLAAFDYRPDVVLNYYPGAPTRDLGYENATAGAVAIDGTEAKIVLTFCEKYNCTVLIDTSEADDWGIAYRNMTGDGALGTIAKGKAEVGITAMYTWYADYVALDMSMYLGRSGITCVVPAPRRLASWLLPVEPFQPVLWGFVVSCLCIEIVALLFMRQFQLCPNPPVPRATWYRNFECALVTTLKLFVSQSNNDYVRSTPLRVMLFACFLNDIVITSIYGGGLASILTVPSFGPAADSLERLHAFGLRWAADSEAWVAGIRGTDDVRMNELLEHFNIYSVDELREMAKTEEMGFTLERLPFGHFAIEDYLTRDVLERMKIMEDDIYFQYTVAFVSRSWPMLERLNALIYMWHSSGFDKYWEWRIVADNLDGHVQKQLEASQYTNLDDIGPVKLGMSNFVGILLIWVVGVLCATLVFCGELLKQHLNRTEDAQTT